MDNGSISKFCPKPNMLILAAFFELYNLYHFQQISGSAPICVSRYEAHSTQHQLKPKKHIKNWYFNLLLD